LGRLFTIAAKLHRPDCLLCRRRVWWRAAPEFRDWFLATVKANTRLREEQQQVAIFALVPDLDMGRSTRSRGWRPGKPCSARDERGGKGRTPCHHGLWRAVASYRGREGVRHQLLELGPRTTHRTAALRTGSRFRLLPLRLLPVYVGVAHPVEGPYRRSSGSACSKPSDSPGGLIQT